MPLRRCGRERREGPEGGLLAARVWVVVQGLTECDPDPEGDDQRQAEKNLVPWTPLPRPSPVSELARAVVAFGAHGS